MTDEQTPRRRRRGAGSRNKLRRFLNVESVIVEEPFTFSVPSDTPAAIRAEAGIKDNEGNFAGDGYYVSATIYNRRYYGVLVEQDALKAGSLLHFRNESISLDLNRRMKMLKQHSPVVKGEDQDEDSKPKSNGTSGSKRPLGDSTPEEEKELKRSKTNHSNSACKAPDHPIEKFQHVMQPNASESDPGYRLLLATYANVSAAAEGDANRITAIEDACQSGGGFVGEFYYQYQVSGNTLETSKVENPASMGLRTSMGFEAFLQNSCLPSWFPLANLQISQQKVLSMLQMKRDHKGGIIWDSKPSPNGREVQGTRLPIESRACFRVGVIGGGIAGLSCAAELLRQAEQERIEIEVVVLEGRSRLGGRLWTDDSSFTFNDGTPFPVDLGAAWIHGIDHNPLASLAKEAGADFITSGEEVRMIARDMQLVDKDVDERMGKLFDNLLDQAADDVWEAEDYDSADVRHQHAVRWYAKKLDDATCRNPNADVSPPRSDAPPHRSSTDVSIDLAIGKAVAKHNQREFREFGPEQHKLLMWNTKNVEYALGANINDLSMKFWDSDERHAFEGDHVLLRQGYSSVVQHIHKGLVARGKKFACELDFAVGKVEYARKSTTLPYAGLGSNRRRKLIEISDTCSVTSRDGKKSHKFDFLVSTLPLGILKESLDEDSSERASRVQFDPPLPFPKVDAIQNTGFGLLNKVYLQFPAAFWRVDHLFDASQTLFGNASGLNPHHYMFSDMGRILSKGNDQPAILMTMISGKEAVNCELLSDDDLVADVLGTLRTIFSKDKVPNPIRSRVTRWGADEFSRGCYTFLPPGATDQDFQTLQSPINGNGDSLTLEGSETMRLFWAGEHTTALHPSMAHGAMLSGIRAAKEVAATINFNFNDRRSGFDKLIPLSIFRKRNPIAKLECSLCHLVGSRVREGSLLAFQRGARQVLVHNNCGESSPEVEVRDGRWKSVIKAINRGKQIQCCMCHKFGATIGCSHENCFRSFHFNCAEDTGWRFERDGKIHFCDLHRTYQNHGPNECDLISIAYYRSKQNPTKNLMSCILCQRRHDLEGPHGKLLAFQQRDSRLLVHDKCARFTTIMETCEDPESAHDADFKNLFELVNKTRDCALCGKPGASVTCHDSNCSLHFHVPCAESTGWNFARRSRFRCLDHRATKKSNKTPTAPREKTPQSTATIGNGPAPTKVNDVNQMPLPVDSSFLQHNLFCKGAETVTNGKAENPFTHGLDVPANAEMCNNGLKEQVGEEEDSDAFSQESESEYVTSSGAMQTPLCDFLEDQGTEDGGNGNMTSSTFSRKSIGDLWGFSLGLVPGGQNGKNAMTIHLCEDSDEIFLVRSINGNKVGGMGENLLDVLALLRETLEVTFGLQSCPSYV